MDDQADPIAERSAIEVEISGLCVARLNAAGRPWQERLNQAGRQAFSCAQAAGVRDRLGSGANGGIPLWAELKSIVGIASCAGKPPIPFAAHTRANTRIDRELLIGALGLDPSTTRLRSFVDQDAEYHDHPLARILTDMREQWFGLVNPFSVDRVLSDFEDIDCTIVEVVQVFDASLSLPGGLPETVMTNLGDRVRAMELTPSDLMRAVQAVSDTTIVCEIARPCPIWLGEEGEYRKDAYVKWPPPMGPRLGILTGNGPESGMSLWRALINGIRKPYSYVPDAFMPEVLVRSVPGMGLSMELEARVDEVREIVVDGIRKLLEAGCKLVTIACNTTIYFEPELALLCSEYDARFISIAEATVPAVLRELERLESGADVGLIGIGTVIDVLGDFSGYRRHLEEAGLTVEARAADEFAHAIKNQPNGSKRVRAFGRLVTSLPNTVRVVILALTEASLVYSADYESRRTGRGDTRSYIDAVQELGDYLAFSYLLDGYQQAKVCQITDLASVSRKLEARFDWTQTTPALAAETGPA
jgi:aspartate racemase